SQYDYFQLMRASGSVQQLRRELAWPDPRGGPLTLCLAQVTRLRRDDVSGGRRLWALIEAGREGCPLSLGVLFLGQWVFTVDLESRFLASGATLVRDAPESWRLWQFYCNGLVRAGRTREVAAVVRRAIAKLGKLQGAERDLLHAIALGPEAEDPYYLYQSWHNLAHVYESAGRFRAAAHAVDQFVSLTRDPLPGSDDHWMSLHDAGTIRWKAGWHAAARVDFDSMAQAIDLLHRETGRCNGYYFAGEYFERSGDLQRALAYYRAGACERDIPSIDGQDLAGLVRVYEQLDEPDSAEAVARFHDSAPERWQA